MCDPSRRDYEDAYASEVKPCCSGPSCGPCGEEEPLAGLVSILTDREAGDDDKFAALATLACAAFPDHRLSLSPAPPESDDLGEFLCPSDEEIDAVIDKFKVMADTAAHQGGSDEPFQAVIAAMEWALGRPITAEWIPCYVSCTIKDATGVRPGEE